jgi:hypothetical protein
MTDRSIVSMSLIGLLSICLYPCQLLAQVPSATIKNNPTTYEDDRIKVVVKDCSRKLQDLICQAVLTSKNSDRTVDLNGNNIKLVDFEGNEYYPSSLKVANRSSENNTIKTELVENIPFKASFIFAKVPENLTQIALLQIPLSGGITATAKFRNFAVSTPNNNTNNVAVKPTKSPITTASSANINPEVSSDNSSICPDNTKILYRATSKNYLMYICGAKAPTHYVGLSKDGSQGITLRLRYYDRTQFSADNGQTNYTIAGDRLSIRKDSKIIYQEKIQVLQPLAGTISAEETPPKSKPKSNPPVSNTTNQKRSTTNQPTPKIKRGKTNGE